MSRTAPAMASSSRPGAEPAAAPRVAVVLSVPFVRNARFLLSSCAYDRLQREFDVVIVSPFADTSAFRDEFGGPNMSPYRELRRHGELANAERFGHSGINLPLYQAMTDTEVERVISTLKRITARGRTPAGRGRGSAGLGIGPGR